VWYVNVNFYESYAPFLYFTFAKFWFLDDNLWAKSQMYDMPFRHFLLKLLHLNLQSNFGVDEPVANILSYLITNDNSCIVNQAVMI
jgi:hypothetical protein